MDKWLFKWSYSHLLRLYYSHATVLRLRTYQMVSAICRLWTDKSKKNTKKSIKSLSSIVLIYKCTSVDGKSKKLSN